MATEEIFESCLPILKDDAIEEEDKVDQLEEFVRKQHKLSGKALDTVVLDVLHRSRNGGVLSSSPTHTILKSRSPAPWQQSSRSATPLGQSPRSATASPTPYAAQRPSFLRMKSGGSPFSSPKPSPRFAFAAPNIPGSPSLDSYEFTPSSTTQDYFDFGSEGNHDIDWLVNDDGGSMTPGEGGFVAPKTVDMSPFDIMRSIFREDKTDDEIQKVLEESGYDLTTAIAAFMESQTTDSSFTAPVVEQEKTYLVGKSMAPSSRPMTPVGQQKSPIVCRYWLSTGQCLRADCRFSHDLSNHLCKYWLQGNCLAGDSCIFSHDPSLLMNQMSLGNPTFAMTPPLETANYNAFPSLGSPQLGSPIQESSLRNLYAKHDTIAPPPGIRSRPALAPEFVPSRPQSRPSSRHRSPAPRSSSFSNTDPEEAFPSLAAAGLRGPRKHHGKRGHGHGHREKELAQSSLADVVRMAPVPTPQSPRRTLRGRGSYTGSRENGAAALAIPAPEKIPWLETGDRANRAYLKARQEAIRHGGARNKFLQSAAQAWHRNDVRAAKTLSLSGQNENQKMRECHRAAATALYEDRNKHLNSNADTELYIDLHGLHPAEAVSYLANALTARRSASSLLREEEGSRRRYLYAIVGTGHHSRGGRDKVGRAIRAYLVECRYAFREFGVPGDKGGAGGATRGGDGYFAQSSGGASSYMGGGGILGIDVTSGDMNRDAVAREEAVGLADDSAVESAVEQAALQVGKVRILKAEDVDRGRLAAG